MERQGRVLVMEDREDWRDEVAGTLRRGGFFVDTAATTAAALDHLERGFYHLLVLDINMNVLDKDNQEGMDLLQRIRSLDPNGAVKIIMLSGRGTTERAIQAFRDYNVVDFIDKARFDNRKFLSLVRDIFANKVRFNPDLVIHWQGETTPEDLVVKMEVDGGQRVQRSTELQARTAAELDDLLRRLFHPAHSVLVRPLAEGAGGGRVLWLQPFYEAGGGHPVVVKVGDYHKIDAEFRNFKEYVQPFIGGGRSTSVLERSYTPRLGGIVYTLLGADHDQVEDFAAFYKRSETVEIQALLERLFLDTCGAWYANPGRLQPRDLAQEYLAALEFDEGKLLAALDRLRKSVQGKERLAFKALDGRTFTNPILAMAGRRFIRPTYVCTIHGDFNAQNILVDGNGYAWLIDFYRTGPGHILRDVAQLDAVVRYQMLGAEEASLEERLLLEQSLNTARRFRDLGPEPAAVAGLSPALEKAYAACSQLRRLARRLVAQNPDDDMAEYYLALFFTSLNVIRFSSALQPVQREHALLSAGLLADCLGL